MRSLPSNFPPNRNQIQPPINNETLIGDARAVVGGKKMHKIGDLFGHNQPLERLPCENLGLIFIRQSKVLRLGL
jgi:hypothetical protein